MTPELDSLRSAVSQASGSAELKSIYDGLLKRVSPAEAARLWWSVFAEVDASET